MASQKGTRNRERQQALQVLFQSMFLKMPVADLLEGGEFGLEDGPLSAYARQIVCGVADYQIPIDKLIASCASNWRLDRINLPDRAILGIALWEGYVNQDIPLAVSIDEAVELAKAYGTDESASFVNGILGKVARLADANPDASIVELASIASEGVTEPEETEWVGTPGDRGFVKTQIVAADAYDVEANAAAAAEREAALKAAAVVERAAAFEAASAQGKAE